MPTDAPKNTSSYNFKVSKIQFQTAAILKNCKKIDYSVATWPIGMKFGMFMHIEPPNDNGS